MSVTDLNDPRFGSKLRVAAGVELGNGTCALLTIVATRNTTNPALSASSTQLLAAGPNRYALKIQNTDGAQTAYLGFGTAAVVGVGIPIAPGATYNWSPNQDPSGITVTAAQMQGIVNAIGSGSPTGNLIVTEIDA